MNARFLQWLMALLGLSGAGSACVHAGAPPPTVYPQWTTTFSHDALAYDNIAPSPDPTSFRLPNGDAIALTSVNGGFVLRRYAGDGSVRLWKQEPFAGDGSQPEAVLRADASGSGFYVLVGASQTAAIIMRFDNDLNRTWSLDIPYDNICNNSCLRLETLADDSVVAMRGFRLMRIGPDAQMRWDVDVGGPGFFIAGDLALAGNGDIWFLTSGGLDFWNSTAVVRRFDVDGTQLSADSSSCNGCGGTLLTGVDIQADGSALVVGSIGSRGFFARYTPSGAPVLWVASADPTLGYDHVAHDANGAIYLGASSMDASEVHRIDPASGVTIWSAPADQFVPRDAGIVAIRKTTAAILATAMDDGGTTLWNLPLTASSAGAVSRLGQAGGNVELLVQDLAPSDDPCAIYPRLLKMDALGALTQFPLPCRPVEVASGLKDIDALPGVGVLANLVGQLVALSPDGERRWQIDACQWCGDYFGKALWPAAVLTSDGGAWAVKWTRPSLALPDGETLIQRIDATGQVRATITAAASVADNTDIRLLGTPEEVVMLHTPSGSGLTWQRARADGTELEVRTYSIPDYYFYIDAVRRLDDGGVTLVVKGRVTCTVGCPPHYITVLRLAADGALLWRYQFPESEAMIALNEDGSATAALPAYDDSGLLHVRKFDGNGQATASLPLADVTLFVQPTQLSGPVQGHWLLRTAGGFPSEDALWLVDAAGHVSASQRGGPYYAWVRTANRFGYLLSELREDGAGIALIDPASLAVQARFFVGSEGASIESFSPWPWRMLDDGSVYGTQLTTRGGLSQMGLARFSAPGSPPFDLVFRDGFD